MKHVLPCSGIIALVHFLRITRWLSIWLRISLTVLLALGPFLHAHYGASHLSGLHVDGMDSVHTSHAHHAPVQVIDVDSEDESAAVGVAPSHPREWQLNLDTATWATLATVWVLFVAAQLFRLPVAQHITCPEPVSRRLYRPNAHPPTLAPPAFSH